MSLRSWWQGRRGAEKAPPEDAEDTAEYPAPGADSGPERHANEATDSLLVPSDRETVALEGPTLRAGDVLPAGATEATRAAGPVHLQPTRVESAAPGTGPVRVAGVLVAVEGEFEGGAWALREGTNRVGREHSCEVCLPSEQLEPRHLNIEIRDGRFQLQPLSEAAVSVNDRPSDGQPLSDGDYVRIGMTTLRFRSIVQT